MVDLPEGRTSRRTALKRLGVVGGAAAAIGLAPESVVARAAPRAAPAEPGMVGTDDAPLGRGAPAAGAAMGTAAPLTTAPGLTYLTFGQFAFQPNLFANGYSPTGTGCYCSTFDGYVVADLALPAGAIIKQIDFGGQNDSGGPASFFVERYKLDGSSSETIGDLAIPSGSPTVQTATLAVDHVVDPEFSYDAATFTSAKVRMFSCRIGFAGPFGLVPITPQKRKLDTRNPGPLTGKFLKGQTRVLSLAPQLPVGAVAAAVNVTVIDTVGGGFLSLFPDGTAWPGTTSINWSATGQTIGNSATVVVSAGRKVKIFCDGGPGAKADVVVDLVGYLT